VESADLTGAEETLRVQLLTDHPGLGTADCALLAVASTRKWTLLTNDSALRRTSERYHIHLSELSVILDYAVECGELQPIDRAWVEYYSKGGTQHRCS
jgi:hypothetical protein